MEEVNIDLVNFILGQVAVALMAALFCMGKYLGSKN